MLFVHYNYMNADFLYIAFSYKSVAREVDLL
jgi:hypothetical protein